jgi:DNA-directed RNA polymerase specialized sigma24 family protein
LEQALWVAAQRAPLLRFVVRHGVTWTDAEDLVHDVLAAACEVRLPADLAARRAWLYRRARSACHNWARARSRQAVHVGWLSLDDGVPERSERLRVADTVGDPAPTAEQRLTEQSSCQAVAVAMRQLSRTDQRLLCIGDTPGAQTLAARRRCCSRHQLRRRILVARRRLLARLDPITAEEVTYRLRALAEEP